MNQLAKTSRSRSSAAHLLSGRARADELRWRAWALLLGLASAASCNALTGVNELQFREQPGDGIVLEGSADAGTDVSPTVTGSLQGPCNALTGAGCAAGAACRFLRETGAPGCQRLPVAPLAPYAACRQDAECPAAFLCEAGVCSKPCESAADCGWPNARCLASTDGQFRRCSRSCDLVTAHAPRAGLQACGEGTRCDFVPEPGAAGYTDCSAAAGSSFDGAECSVHADCPSDFRCESERCAAACGADGACAGGLRCGGSVAELAGQRVGACCSIPAGQPCDLLTGCGCAPGSTCSLDGAGAVVCRVLPAEPRAAYASCEQHAECPARYSCIGGACKLHCDTLADCGAEGTQCVAVTFESAPLPGVSFCARGCDVLSPQAPAAGLLACGAGASCIDVTAELGGTDCSAAGAGTQGAQCELARDCASGFGCFQGSCARWCTPGGTECGLGLSCGGAYDTSGRTLGSCCTPPLEQACHWLTDCGCGAGETCSVDAGAQRFCRAVSDTPVAAYSACDADAQCPRYHQCAFGVCMQRCETSADCAGDSMCLVLNEADPGTGICSRHCDMLSPSAPAPGFQPCGPGLRCLDFDGPEGATTACIFSGTVLAGGACTGTADCGEGLDCEAGLCLPLCELGAAACAPGFACSPRALATAPVGGRGIGVCSPEE